MQENGWIKLHRSILKWEWYDDVNTKAVFLHLLLIANIEDRTWHGVEIKRGSTITSYAKLAKETKLTVREVRTAIEHLESTGEVTRLKHAKFTVISINNYGAFQGATSISTSSRQGGDKVATSSFNNKNNKNKKNDENSSCSGSANGGGVPDDDHDNDKRQSRFEKVKDVVYGMGYDWPPEEFQAFYDFNDLRGWTLSPQKAAQKWDYNMKHPERRSGWRSKYDKPMTEKEIEEMNAYQALSKRFKKD